jgi:hypothetical protein
MEKLKILGNGSNKWILYFRRKYEQVNSGIAGYNSI